MKSLVLFIFIIASSLAVATDASVHHCKYLMKNQKQEDIQFISCKFDHQSVMLKLHSQLSLDILKLDKKLYDNQLDNNEDNPWLLSQCDLTTHTEELVEITCAHGVYRYLASDSLKDFQHSELNKSDSLNQSGSVENAPAVINDASVTTP